MAVDFKFSGEFQTLPAGSVKWGISEWKKKPWGQTRDLHCDGALEVIECEIERGGFSSLHIHHHKANSFLVVSGRLLVIVGKTGEPIESHELRPGHVPLQIAAGVAHRFEAREPTVLIEHYWPDNKSGKPVDPADIERFTSGGLREPDKSGGAA